MRAPRWPDLNCLLTRQRFLLLQQILRAGFVKSSGRSLEPRSSGLPGPSPPRIPACPSSARRPAGGLGMQEVSDLGRIGHRSNPSLPSAVLGGREGGKSLFRQALGSEPGVLAQRPDAGYNPGARDTSPSGALGALQPPAVGLEFMGSETSRHDRNLWSLATEGFAEGGPGEAVWKARFFSGCSGCFSSPFFPLA